MAQSTPLVSPSPSPSPSPSQSESPPPQSFPGHEDVADFALLQLQGDGLIRATSGIGVSSLSSDAMLLVFRPRVDLTCVRDARLSAFIPSKVPDTALPTTLAVYPAAVFDPTGNVSRYTGATLLADRPRSLVDADETGWITWDVTRVIHPLSRHQPAGTPPAYPLEVRPPHFDRSIPPDDAWYFDGRQNEPTSPILALRRC